jgi:hypothetical protein
MKKILSFLILLSLILPPFVLADVNIENPLTATSFEEIVDNIINFLFTIAIALVPLMIIIGAFYITTAGGDTNRVTTGKNIILYALIGFAIILLAKGIVGVIEQILGV